MVICVCVNLQTGTASLLKFSNPLPRDKRNALYLNLRDRFPSQFLISITSPCLLTRAAQSNRLFYSGECAEAQLRTNDDLFVLTYLVSCGCVPVSASLPHNQ